MRYVIIALVCIILASGCTQMDSLQNTTGASNPLSSILSVSLKDVNTNPEQYVHSTITVEGVSNVYPPFPGVAFAGDTVIDWSIGDDQGYKLLVQPLPESGRVLYSNTKIKMTGMLKRVCLCENDVDASYMPSMSCKGDKDSNSIRFSYDDKANLTKSVEFFASRSYVAGKVCESVFSGSYASWECILKSPEDLEKYEYACGITPDRPEYSISKEKIRESDCLSQSTKDVKYRCRADSVSYYLEGAEPYQVLEGAEQRSPLN